LLHALNVAPFCSPQAFAVPVPANPVSPAEIEPMAIAQTAAIIINVLRKFISSSFLKQRKTWKQSSRVGEVKGQN
jgi:hypothetical protein